jgi:glycosyltransferase involved in cell wall biosynthesis
MRIAALTSGWMDPSARFRLRQNFPHLRTLGFDIQEYCPAVPQGARLPGILGRIRARYMPPLVLGQMALNLALRMPGIVGSRQADVTWLERNFIPGLDNAAWLLGKPLVLDIDDAIWLYNPMGRGQIARLVGRADMVFAGNTFLADWCSQYCKNIRVIPTAVDCERFVPRASPKPAGSPFIIGWTGTSGNFRFLKLIEGALTKFLLAHPSARLMIVAERPPNELNLPPGQLIFRKWESDTEHLILHEFDVGIMPLDDSDLSRGKCSFKMLQYMASGIPVIASPYGMNADVFALGNVGAAAITQDDWLDALNKNFQSTGANPVSSSIARNLAIDAFSVAKIGPLISQALNNVQGS